MKKTDTFSNLRVQLAERRMVRQRNKRLEVELASFVSPAERLELDAILSRHSEDEIAELEAMLGRSALGRPAHR